MSFLQGKDSSFSLNT